MNPRKLLLALAVLGLVASACGGTTASDVVDKMDSPALISDLCLYVEMEGEDPALKWLAGLDYVQGVVEEKGVAAKDIFAEMLSRCSQIEDWASDAVDEMVSPQFISDQCGLVETIGETILRIKFEDSDFAAELVHETGVAPRDIFTEILSRC